MSGRSEQGTNFSSFLTAVLAIAGAAIGVGNFWRFPYMMGSYGGSAFLIVFLVFLFFVGIPAAVAEFAVARSHRKSTIAIFSSLYGYPGYLGGHVIVLGMLLMTTYYTVVVGALCYAAAFSIFQGIGWGSIDAFTEGLKDNNLQFVASLAATGISVVIVFLGIRRGIERCSNVIVPAFFISMLYLTYVSLSQPGAIAEFREFLVPDFGKIGFKETFAALGQCFYSLALGGLVLVAYGRHLRADSDLRRMGLSAAISDTSASILTSLFIVPAVLVFGLQLDMGPTLIFETMPRLFSEMDFGQFLGALMLSSMALMALLSMVGALQFILEALADLPVWSRVGRDRLLLLIGATIAVISIIPAYKPGALATMDLVIGSAMPVIGSLALIVGLMWRSNRSVVVSEIYGGRPLRIKDRLFLFWLKWIIPAILAFVLVGTLYEVL